MNWFFLLTFVAPDDAPQDIEPINVESRLIELMWSPPPADTHNGEIVHYIIDYTEVQTGRTSVTMSFNTTVTLGNLHPFYEYNITVTAFTVDFGPPSTSITIQTLEDGETKRYQRVGRLSMYGWRRHVHPLITY